MNRTYEAPAASSLVSKWFISRAQSDASRPLDNLKLQKLLYLAQSRYQFEHHTPLLKERFLAWKHGPVVRTVWAECNEFGDRPIRMDLAVDGPWNDLAPDIVDVLDGVWEEFGALSGWDLRQLTHRAGPWPEHYVEGANVEIPNQLIAAAWPVLAADGGGGADETQALRAMLQRYRALHEELPARPDSGSRAHLLDELRGAQDGIDEAGRLHP